MRNGTVFEEVIKDIGRYEELWGQGLSQPMVALENIAIKESDLSLMGKGTFKIAINNNVSCIKFNGASMYDDFSNYSPMNVTLICTCHLNEWQGRTLPQLKLVDYQI